MCALSKGVECATRAGLKETASERGYSVVQVMTEQAMSWKLVRLEVLDPPTIQEQTEALIQDMVPIVTVCAGRLYGHRAIGMRKRVETVRKRSEQEEETDGTGQPHNQVAP